MGGRESDNGDLPPPVVSPDLYDDTYFRHACGGADTWRESGGSAADGMYYGALQKTALCEGEVVVDLGTGRGELLAVAVEMGAQRAIGIEYAEAAVAMARRTIDAHAVSDRAEVLLADARSVPLEDSLADLVTMLDVVEHLAPEELARSLSEAHRLLRPGGRILIHTFPTRTIYDWTYRYQRALVPGRRKRWPVEPRHDFEPVLHVNEQTVWRLRKAMRGAGFTNASVELGEWIYTDMVPDERARRLYHWLAKVPFTPIRALGVSNLWGRATR